MELLKENNFHCRVCNKDSIDPVKSRVLGATRLLMNEYFTVWICQGCQSINAHETVDYKHIYENYPIQKQENNFFSKAIFSQQLKILKKIGLNKTHTIIDYGCGSGFFVKYLVNKGYKAFGYEPYNSKFNSTTILSEQFDFVISQDVIEHVDDPHDFLDKLKGLSKKNTTIVVGTPYADHIDLDDRKDHVGSLHQPFHRFIVSKKQVPVLFEDKEWKISQVIEKYYLDTLIPFVNEQFLLSYFKAGGYVMDVGFEPLNFLNFITKPELILTGLFGGLFTRKQNLLIVLNKHQLNGINANKQMQ